MYHAWTIDAESTVPLFLQLEHLVESKIREGLFDTGDKLPSEREISSLSGIARGTVKKALSNLVSRGILKAVKGKGTFVTDYKTGSSGDRLETAMDMIRSLIYSLEKLNFSHRESGALFMSELENRQIILSKLSVLAVDCNPEALEVYLQQLGTLSHVNFRSILLEDLKQSPDKVLANYELIITTSNHFDEVSMIAPEYSEKILQIGVMPSPETIFQIGKLSVKTRLGVICISQKFFEIVKFWVKKFYPNIHMERLEKEDKNFNQKINTGYDVLVLPVISALGLSVTQLKDINNFRQRGGSVIRFEYQIDGGSMVLLEKALDNLIQESLKGL
ncbi:MAG: GntR family transcriptional regulator [Deltaproteobacteria bacterium]|nr:GntR family transcriptional regulator [Deltaproteobacteria bacterium]